MPILKIGDNQPTDFDAMKGRVAALQENAELWLKEVAEIDGAERAQRCEDFIGQVSAELKAVEDERVRLKEPFLEGGRAIDRQYNPLKAPLEIIKDSLDKLRKRWLKREDDRIKAEKAAAEAEAKRLADEAAKAAEAASGNEAPSIANVLAAQQAQEKAKEAAKAAEALPARASVKGQYSTRATVLRHVWAARITNFSAAVLYYRNNKEVAELLTRLASAEARAGVRSIKGFEIYEETI